MTYPHTRRSNGVASVNEIEDYSRADLTEALSNPQALVNLRDDPVQPGHRQANRKCRGLAANTHAEMRHSTIWRIAFVMVILSLIPMTISGEEASREELQTELPALPGVELAHAVSISTGLAVTPLFGVTAIGAWKYYKTPIQLRNGLPWYTSPWFWGFGLLVTLVMASKDFLLGPFPVLKKPLDALKTLESKFSAALLAVPVLIPMFMSAFSSTSSMAENARSPELTAWSASFLPLPDSLPSFSDLIFGGLGTVIAVLAFLVVWLAFHAIDVLILCSPFGILDLFLRSLKVVVLVGLVGATVIHPYLGLLFSLLILVIAIPIAGWSYRLMVFGSVVSWDLVSRKHKKNPVANGQVTAFTAGGHLGLPPRTYGKLVRDRSQRLSFRYRPWLVFPGRNIGLPGKDYVVGRNLLCPVVQCLSADNTGRVSVIRFPPRYRSHEEQLVRHLALTGVVDSPLSRGLKAAVAWCREILGQSKGCPAPS